MIIPPVVGFAQLCTTETTAELLGPLNHCKAAIKAAMRGPITQGSDIGEAVGNAVLEASEVGPPRQYFAHELVVVADVGYAELLRPIIEQTNLWL